MIDLLVNIDVPDLEAAATFYTGAFGLSIGRRLGDGAVELLGAGVPVWLLAKPAGSAATKASPHTRSYDRHWTPVHLDFVVADVDAALTRAETAGARIESPTTVHEWGKIAIVVDPFGHGICLIEFAGRGYDEIATLERP